MQEEEEEDFDFYRNWNDWAQFLFFFKFSLKEVDVH